MVEILALVLQHDEQAVLCAVELALEAGVATKTHAKRLLRLDLVILDELGYLPFNLSDGVPLFYLLSKLCERNSVIITTNLSFSKWARVFGDAKMTTALLDRLICHCHIIEIGNDSFRFKDSATKPKTREDKLPAA